MTSWKDNNLLGSRRLVEEVLDLTSESERIVARDKGHLRELIKERIAEIKKQSRNVFIGFACFFLFSFMCMIPVFISENK